MIPFTSGLLVSGEKRTLLLSICSVRSSPRSCLRERIISSSPMILTPHFPSVLRASIDLPSSKSLSNRALLLGALSGNGAQVERRSTCDDTCVMSHALEQRPEVVDILAAGTAMRFLTAYFAGCKGEVHTLTGTQRMKERPIGVLVEALRRLGADIQYEATEGFPPLRITGRQLQGGTLDLPADVSSQYISALLMVAPRMCEGLTLRLQGTIISRPYIDMTLQLMARFGIQAQWLNEQTLYVPAQPYATGVTYTVESDWSAASYWYEMVALTSDAEARIELPWLLKESLQGDAAVRRFFEPLGVQTTFCPERGNIVLQKNPSLLLPEGEPLVLDLINQPDLAQTLVVTCALLRRPFRFTGLRSLRIKETDRTAALAAELLKFGITLGVEGDDVLYISSYPTDAPCYDGTPIATYHDHRMALAFAPAALRCPGIQIADPEVVSKSYPDYWKDIASLSAK